MDLIVRHATHAEKSFYHLSDKMDILRVIRNFLQESDSALIAGSPAPCDPEGSVSNGMFVILDDALNAFASYKSARDLLPIEE